MQSVLILHVDMMKRYLRITIFVATAALFIGLAFIIYVLVLFRH